MPYLNEIIALVNNSIRERSLTDKRFSGAKLEGIAYPVVRDGEGEEQQVIPAIVDLNKVERYVGVDDSYPLQLYHRILSNQYQDGEKKQQYGDGIQLRNCFTEAVMIVFAKRAAIKLTAEQLEMMLVAGFPDVFTAVELESLSALTFAKVVLKASDMDALRVFGNEYRNVKFFLGPEDIFFSIGYRIESSFQKGCFNICDPCNG